MNIILVEYPGYSIYIDNQPNPKKIFKESKIIKECLKIYSRFLIIKFLNVEDI